MAGRVWLSGESPYRYADFHREWQRSSSLPELARSFVYPPHVALPSMGLALLSHRSAQRVFDALNLLALVVGAAFLGRLAERDWAFPVAIALSAVAAWLLGTFHLGQTALLAATGVLGAWRRNERPLPAFFWALLALMKPQLTLPALIPLLWTRARWAVLLAAGTVAMLAWPVLPQLTDSLARHRSIGFNQDLAWWSPIHGYDLVALMPLVVLVPARWDRMLVAAVHASVAARTPPCDVMTRPKLDVTPRARL